MLKLPVIPVLLCATWKFEAVAVMVNVFPAQAPVPACDPRTAMLPAAVAEALQRLAVIVGRVDACPLIHTINAPKLGTFGMSSAVSLIGHVKKELSFSFTANEISS